MSINELINAAESRRVAFDAEIQALREERRRYAAEAKRLAQSRDRNATDLAGYLLPDLDDEDILKLEKRIAYPVLLERSRMGNVRIVDRDGHVLTLAAMQSGEEDRMPPQWAPYVMRLVEGATARIARDQARGIAPNDIPARLSAQALLAMVERHVTLELIQGGGDAHQSIRVLAELWWRAVYSRPEDIASG